MTLNKDEFRIEDDGIWISKAALEECRDNYRKLVCELKPKSKKEVPDFRYPYYIGKADVCTDLLMYFEPLEL